MLAISNRNKFTFGFVAVSPLPPAAAVATSPTAKSSLSSLWLSLPSSSSFSSSLVPMITKNVAIVGCGPSGCLLAHLLLEQNNNNNNNKNTQLRVTVVESRSDPRELHADGQQRAYALGIGIRGRTAIRQSQNIGTTTTNSSSSEDETIAEDGLWQAVRNCGYESQRFQLHAGPFVIPLRQEETKPNDGRTTEPSLLVYQSKLCGSLIEELERRYSTTTTSNTNEHDKGGGDNLQLLFNTPIQKCDVETMTLIPDSRSNNTGGGGGCDDDLGPFDVIIGCDGVNSIVRQTIESVHRGFESVTTQLDGEFKVVQMENFVFPSNVDPTAVSLIIPKAGSCTAFIEPTGTNSCCILFATNTKNRTATDTAAAAATNPIMSETKNKTAIVEALETAFPQWGGKGNKNNENNIHDAIADQLLVRKAGSASSVVCNTYNYGGKLALVGDSAHGTKRGSITSQDSKTNKKVEDMLGYRIYITVPFLTIFFVFSYFVLFLPFSPPRIVNIQPPVVCPDRV